jgi:hypothetical protein
VCDGPCAEWVCNFANDNFLNHPIDEIPPGEAAPQPSSSRQILFAENLHAKILRRSAYMLATADYFTVIE